MRKRPRRPSRGRAGAAATYVAAAALAVTLLDQGSAATGATLDEPTTPILDNFNGRGVEDPLDQWGNWAGASIDGSGPTMATFGATAGQNDGALAADSYRTAAVAGNTEVYATLASPPDNNSPTYLYLHLGDVGGSGWDGYRLRLERWVSSANDTVRIEKISNGAATNLAHTALATDFAAGQTFLLRRTGSTLTAWRKNAGVWDQLLSAADGVYQGGRIGFGASDTKARWDDFGGSGSTTPEPPPPTLPSTALLDDFNRLNEDPLSQGGAWASTPIRGSGHTLEVLANRAFHNEGFVYGDSYRVADIAGDAEVYATMSSNPDNNAPIYLYLHLGDVEGAGWDGYRLRLERWVSSVADTIAIQKIVNGQVTYLVSGATSPDLAGGDLFLLRRVGSRLEAWRRKAGVWTKRLSTSDTTFTHGMLGLGCHDSTCRWDDFGGGPLEAPPPPPPPPSGPPPDVQTFGTGDDGRGMHAWSGSGLFADPVNSRTGAFTTSFDDLELPGTGVPFAWSRSYTSADATVGRLGPGWTDSYSASLAVQSNGDARVHGEDGQQINYTKQGDGAFAGAAGSLSTLSSVTGGYELRRTDQVAYLFDVQGRLLSIKDRNHRGVTLGYDGSSRLTTVTDSAGRQATISYNAENLVSQVQTADGRSVAFGYTAGRLTTVTDVRGKIWRYTYDGDGRLASIVDPLNHMQVTNVYGQDGRVQSQTDALQKTTTFGWNAQSETATATDANQKAWTHDYDEGVLVAEIDPLTNDTQLVRDDDLNTTSVTGPTNETTAMTYDEAGNMLSATAPPSLGGAQKTFVYNARNDIELVTDARGKVTDYAYDSASGNLTSVTQDGVQVGSYTYDAAGRVETFTDGNEQTWTYAYFSATGYLQSSTDPLGNTTTYTYDAAGRVATRVDPKGNVAGCSCAADFTWAYTYNDAGQLLTERNPLGHQTTSVYDDAGRLTSSSDALGRTTSYTYDDANRVLTETAPDPDGAGPLAAPVTTHTYDNVGNKLSETDPRGNTTTIAYDGANRLVSTTGPDPDGAGPLAAPVTTQTYDANGNLASTVEPRGNVSGANPDEYRTTFTYDAAGRMLTETRPDPDGAGPETASVTTNVYDPVGNLQSARDGNDHSTSYTYDGAGRIRTVTGPDLGVTTYGYDDAGNLLTRTDDNGHTTTFGYDDAGRLTTETTPDPDGPGPQGPAVTSYTHDPNGNRLTVTDPNGNASPASGDGRTTYGYDRANQQTSIDHSDTTPDVSFTYDAVGNRLTMVDGSGTETRTYDALGRLSTVTRGSNTLSYAYDAASNVIRRTYPGNTIVNYAYDALSRLTSVASGSQTTTYAYDIASNSTQTTLPSGNGYVETRAYDRAGRLTEVKNQRGATVLSHFVSTFDPVGNPTQIVRSGGLSLTQTYAYDANDRITGVCFQAGSCAGASDPFIRWTYDNVGNRLTEQRPTGTTSYTYDTRDRLLSAGSTSFAYDQNGNQTQKGPRTFTYDLANRLRTTTQGSTTTTYSYDGDGKRLQASTGSTSSSNTNFLWDVSFGLPQVARENNGSGSLQRRYVYGERRLSLTNSSNTTYYHYDPLGSVANMTSSGGSTRWTYAYEPFGTMRTQQRSGDSAPTNFMKFTGEYFDPTGLYHLRARQYDPALGRFLAPDPIADRPKTPLVASYAYVANRPGVVVDPSGEEGEPIQSRFIAVDKTGLAVSAEVAIIRIPSINIDGLLCAARAGYPLARIGEYNGGVAAHKYKHRNDRVHFWQNENAIDLNVPVGTGVCAVFKGRISPTLGYGLSSEGYRLHLVGVSDTAFYTHLSKIVVKPERLVKKGQLLGYSGCGREGVPHLHIALRYGNPERYGPPYRKPVNYGGCP